MIISCRDSRDGISFCYAYRVDLLVYIFIYQAAQIFLCGTGTREECPVPTAAC
jgi:hypothetical protein